MWFLLWIVVCRKLSVEKIASVVCEGAQASWLTEALMSSWKGAADRFILEKFSAGARRQARSSAPPLIMAFPYQCLTALTRPSANGEDWAVFGATGSTLAVQSSNGTKSVWPTEQDVEKVSPLKFVQSFGNIGADIMLASMLKVLGNGAG